MAPVFDFSLKYWYLSKTIPLIECLLLPPFLLFRSKEKGQINGNVFSQGDISLGFFVIFWSSAHLIPNTRKKTEDDV